jgi:dihydrofolate synthase / folylpolyglutamate synthase
MKKSNQSHSNEKSLAEWLSYLESIHHTEIDMGLTRIKLVAKRLSIDLCQSIIITVAGTNGKGTTCAFLENYLLNVGKSVAVYSSPHIESFNERLRINKADVDDNPLIEAFEQIEVARQNVSLTYYEYTTLAALIVLAKVKPDVIILEVGLGGRLDATNMVDADIAVLTTVDLDHQAFLGDTRELIGREKAGIFRANRPAVIGDVSPPESVLHYGSDISANLICRGVDFQIETSSGIWQWQSNDLKYDELPLPSIPLDNVATAISVLSIMPVALEKKTIIDTIEQTKVAGRTEMFKEHCDVMLDVGHNPLAARYLASVLEQRGYPRVIAVVGMLSDKDIKSTLEPLYPVIDRWHICDLDVPRGANGETFKNFIENDDDRMHYFNNVEEGYRMALSEASANDLVLVFGSFFTVAAVRKYFRR